MEHTPQASPSVRTLFGFAACIAEVLRTAGYAAASAVATYDEPRHTDPALDQPPPELRVLITLSPHRAVRARYTGWVALAAAAEDRTSTLITACRVIIDCLARIDMAGEYRTPKESAESRLYKDVTQAAQSTADSGSPTARPAARRGAERPKQSIQPRAMAR